MRSAAVGDAGWSVVPHAVAVLLPMGVFALLFAWLAFLPALSRERRLGTLGLY